MCTMYHIDVRTLIYSGNFIPSILASSTSTSTSVSTFPFVRTTSSRWNTLVVISPETLTFGFPSDAPGSRTLTAGFKGGIAVGVVSIVVFAIGLAFLVKAPRSHKPCNPPRKLGASTQRPNKVLPGLNIRHLPWSKDKRSS
ncbi:hypothetical protein BCR34DRAFT_570790 [Clohesyomyces aquaticus]|uniref:Uncharacterized protein n=1 Tax=Clohesyomyces aquaticus TaxID=1231657 RepID=A0A1Y1ZBD2_9PLEO|nr:hypothetical protein BCR34DRAFT_570790 [Clohesyomyces aquaticus]